MTAAQRVIWLLRTYYDAREAWDTRANGGGGVLLMPSDYLAGSRAIT